MKPGLSTGAIIGIVLGVLFVTATLYLCLRRITHSYIDDSERNLAAVRNVPRESYQKPLLPRQITRASGGQSKYTVSETEFSQWVEGPLQNSKSVHRISPIPPVPAPEAYLKKQSPTLLTHSNTGASQTPTIPIPGIPMPTITEDCRSGLNANENSNTSDSSHVNPNSVTLRVFDEGPLRQPTPRLTVPITRHQPAMPTPPPIVTQKLRLTTTEDSPPRLRSSNIHSRDVPKRDSKKPTRSSLPMTEVKAPGSPKRAKTQPSSFVPKVRAARRVSDHKHGDTNNTSISSTIPNTEQNKDGASNGAEPPPRKLVLNEDGLSASQLARSQLPRHGFKPKVLPGGVIKQRKPSLDDWLKASRSDV